MKRAIAFLSLFTSAGTLVCCALPALFVALGLGAAFAGIVGSVPQLIWFSENKLWIFSIGAAVLALAGILQWKARGMACPIDPIQGAACKNTRDWSKVIYFVSIAIYMTGAFFTFVADRIF